LKSNEKVKSWRILESSAPGLSSAVSDSLLILPQDVLSVILQLSWIIPQ
jgi:hypothetical protein